MCCAHDGVQESIAAVALIAIFDAGKRPAIFLAVCCALLDGESIAILVVAAGQGFGGSSIIGATNILEVAYFVTKLRKLSDDTIGVRYEIENRLDRTNILRSTKRSTSWRIASREYLEQAFDGLIHKRWLFWAVLVEERVEGLVQWWALLYISIVDCSSGAHALSNGILKDFGIPAIQEISMEAVAGGITIGEDEVATLLLPNVVDRVDDLNEQMRHNLRMRRRADTGIDTAHISSV